MPTTASSKRVKVSKYTSHAQIPRTQFFAWFNIIPQLLYQSIMPTEDPYARTFSNKRNPRVQGTSIYRPFVYGSVAKPFDPAHRPPNINAEHTHQWSVYVRGVDGEDISYWLRKVQFKLHETYPNSLRTIEAPPFEVTETGWGEFEVQIKMYFVSEAAEKPQTLWHFLRLHPWEGDLELQKERRDAIRSQSYEEIIFTEPTETLYEIMTSGAPVVARGKSKGAKGAPKHGHRTAELPRDGTPENPFSQRAEGAEIVRLSEARKLVEKIVVEEREKLAERERVMAELNKK